MQKKDKALTFKNNAPFIKCISKINREKIDIVEDLDVVMPMYNLLEYSKSYRKTAGSFWNYYRDEPSDPLLILNLLNIKQVLQEKLIILVLVKLVMMQIKLVKMKLKLLFH